MLRGTTERETCTLNGWGPGTLLRGYEDWSDGRGVWTTIKITAVGEGSILARCVRHEKTTPDGETISDATCVDREKTWTLNDRDWTALDTDADTTATPHDDDPDSESWTYEADHAQDHGGADTFHHIVCGERHIAEVATEADARLIIAAVNASQRKGALTNDDRESLDDAAAEVAAAFANNEPYPKVSHVLYTAVEGILATHRAADAATAEARHAALVERMNRRVAADDDIEGIRAALTGGEERG